MNTRKLPSKWWYILPSILFIIAFAFVFNFVLTIISISDKEEGFVVPGSYELVIEEPGTYTIFHEYQTTIDGKYYDNDEDISGMSIILENKADGSIIELRAPANSNYSYNGRQGTSVAAFKVREPGTYILSAEYENGQGPDVVLTVSEDFVKSIMLSLGSIFAGIGFVILSIISFIVILIIRITRKKQTPAI